MRKISIYVLLFLFFYIPNIKGQSLDAFFEESNSFFAKYAHHNSVQYKHLHQDAQALDALIHTIENVKLETAEQQEQKAFFINVYNLLVIKNVVTHYPIASPNEVVEFWDEIEHVVAGEKYTLEALKTKIVHQFPDPLLHFVLVNGTVSAAPIADFAYQPATLDQQLKNRVIEALNNSNYIKYNSVTEEVLVPRIFKTNNASFQPSVTAFINKYRAEKIPEDVQVKYAYEDWSLNAYFDDTNTTLKNKKTNNKKKKKKGYSPLAQVITLPKGVGEVSLFNSIYTVTSGDNIFGTRNSYFNSYFTAFYGVNGHLDIGMTLLFRSSRERDAYNASPFKVFEFERTPLKQNPRSSSTSSTYADWGLSHAGFQVRFAPFKNINLSFEQGIMLPLQNLPKENTVDNSIYWVTQMYYIHPFNSQLQLFLALTYWQPIRIGEQFRFQPPLLRGFLNYFVTQRFSVFATTMYFLEWGVGVKYMLTPKFEIQVMYSYYLPIPGVYDIFSPGANSIMTYNMGLRYRF